MAGFVLCNISAIVINDLFDGFGSILEQISNLPYILYAIFSLVISFVLTLILRHMTESIREKKKQAKKEKRQLRKHGENYE